LYVTWECKDGFTPPRPLGAGVNSKGWDFGPRLSPDGRWLYFTSNRSDFDEPPAQPLTFDELMRRLRLPRNGLRDVYRVPVEALQLRSPCAQPAR
jgi:hypothetical protein